mmetsp:Transcript_25851/g.42443  ORF Transcript_25851/g.42443 Transcript_25851/m.42443 type:complete len:1264 (-) Transcript_25851:613-4404(-)
MTADVCLEEELYEKIGKGDCEAVDALLSQNSALNVNWSHGRIKNCPTLLHRASVTKGCSHCIVALLLRGCHVDVRDETVGSTPLACAAERGYSKVVEILVNKGADVNAPDCKKNRPIHLAADAGHYETVKLLLDLGAEPDLQSKDGYTPLHRAVMHCFVDIADLLLERGASVTAQSRNGKTMLYFAVQSNGEKEEMLELVELLLEHGAAEHINVAVDDTEKFYSTMTPLDLAVFLGYAEVAKTLIESGGDIVALRQRSVRNRCNRKSDDLLKKLMQHTEASNGTLEDKPTERDVSEERAEEIEAEVRMQRQMRRRQKRRERKSRSVKASSLEFDLRTQSASASPSSSAASTPKGDAHRMGSNENQHFLPSSVVAQSNPLTDNGSAASSPEALSDHEPELISNGTASHISWHSVAKRRDDSWGRSGPYNRPPNESPLWSSHVTRADLEGVDTSSLALDEQVLGDAKVLMRELSMNGNGSSSQPMVHVPELAEKTGYYLQATSQGMGKTSSAHTIMGPPMSVPSKLKSGLYHGALAPRGLLLTEGVGLGDYVSSPGEEGHGPITIGIRSTQLPQRATLPLSSLASSLGYTIGHTVSQPPVSTLSSFSHVPVSGSPSLASFAPVPPGDASGVAEYGSPSNLATQQHSSSSSSDQDGAPLRAEGRWGFNPTSSLWVGWGSYPQASISANMLKSEFGKYGKVLNVRVMDPNPYAFVEFGSLDEAMKGKLMVDGKTICGATLRVNYGKGPQHRDGHRHQQQQAGIAALPGAMHTGGVPQQPMLPHMTVSSGGSMLSEQSAMPPGHHRRPSSGASSVTSTSSSGLSPPQYATGAPAPASASATSHPPSPGVSTNPSLFAALGGGLGGARMPYAGGSMLASGPVHMTMTKPSPPPSSMQNFPPLSATSQNAMHMSKLSIPASLSSTAMTIAPPVAHGTIGPPTKMSMSPVGTPVPQQQLQQQTTLSTTYNPMFGSASSSAGASSSVVVSRTSGPSAANGPSSISKPPSPSPGMSRLPTRSPQQPIGPSASSTPSNGSMRSAYSPVPIDNAPSPLDPLFLWRQDSEAQRKIQGPSSGAGAGAGAGGDASHSAFHPSVVSPFSGAAGKSLFSSIPVSSTSSVWTPISSQQPQQQQQQQQQQQHQEQQQEAASHLGSNGWQSISLPNEMLPSTGSDIGFSGNASYLSHSFAQESLPSLESAAGWSSSFSSHNFSLGPSLCRFCSARPVDGVLLTCRHPTCGLCASHLHACPLCSAQIVGFLRTQHPHAALQPVF